MSEARTRLYQLVDAARDDGQVVVVEKRDAKARHTYRAALIPVGRLDAGSRARLAGWPSWARTAARPKLGDLVVEAGDSPVRRGVPQVLLGRTTPLAVLVEASLVPPGDVLVAVPGEALTDAGVADAAQLPSAAPGAVEGPAVPVVGPGTSLAVPGAAEDPPPVRAAGAAAPGHAPALDDATAVPAAAGGGDPQGAGQREADRAAEAEQAGHAAAQEAVGGQDAGGTAGEDGTAASARTAEVPPPVPAGGGGPRRLLHGLGEVAGQALTEAVAPSAPPRFGFGLRALDAALGSLPSGVLTVVAAEPHAGGSLLGVHAARHTALTHELPVLYAASGLSRTDVAMRVIASEAELDYRRLRTGDLTPDEQQAAAQVQARLAGAALHVDDGTGLTAEAIAETAPYVEGLALVVVDRFQHAADPFIPLSGPALPAAARVLAHLARSRNVPVLAVLDTAEPEVLAALDAAHLTLTLTRTHNDAAQVTVAERDLGELTTVPLRADLACARFTDLPDPAVPHTPDGVLPAAQDAPPATMAPQPTEPAPGTPSVTAGPAVTASRPAAGAVPGAEPTSPAAPGAALQDAPASAGPADAGAAGTAVGEELAAVEAELLEAALPFTSGARHGLSARLTGALAALREASTQPGRDGELAGLRQALADLAARRPAVPPTPEGERLGAALAAFAAAHRDTPATAPAPVTSAVLLPSLAPGSPEAGPTPAQAPDLAVAEAELLAAAAPFLTGTDDRSPLSVHARHVLGHLRDVLAPGYGHLRSLLSAARARAAELGGRRLRLPATPEADRLRTALAAYRAAATAAGITPEALPPVPALIPPTPAPTPEAPPTASLTVTEPAPAPAAAPTAAAEVSGAAPGTAEDAPAAGPARRVVEGAVLEAPSASFSDDTPPPEGTPGTGGGGRNYSFFLSKISAAVEQALDETDGDIDEAIKKLKKKAVPDSMALFKLTRVGGNYVHTVYPPALDFLSKPGQGEADGIWEGRHKWRNVPLYEAIKKGERDPLDVFGLDTNAAYLSAFKTHLPIGALKHDPTGGFDRRKAGVHRVDHFEWPHAHLPSPLGNRIEPGPYLLDEATVRLLIRCSELDLSAPPRILESWTSGASEALLEKFRRVLQQARQTAIETGDSVTEEYVKAMYSRFTSTIGESGKNRELRRPEWVHTIRSQAFASLWLKAWKAHKAGLILVQASGVDELHVAGGDWKTVWEEGRKPTQMKVKRVYTLGETK
ncbi:DnaB-like helicase C-terminal domain-containing protein [Streptomyces sp. CC219B]|uniref:DnaB-like helicase C-terminal domain-containing protein n=1 Tax=Streptomyces sp. CC219B TaxID=3044574 RepID=UPI0024A98653|nr:DnaB-like helicase C-terminal domain-containing protein [Streptomyces sp. CC219B]